MTNASQVTFELVEIEPNVLQGRANGEPIDGAKSCHRGKGETCELWVHQRHDGRWSGSITMPNARLGRSGNQVMVARLTVRGKPEPKITFHALGGSHLTANTHDTYEQAQQWIGTYGRPGTSYTIEKRYTV